MSKDNPRTIIHEGILSPVEGLEIPCYVLKDGTRILSGRGLQQAVKIGQRNDKKAEYKSGVELTRFLDSKWFKSIINNKIDLEHFEPITCYKGRQKINGYEATVLVDLCDIILEARKAGVNFTERQSIIADQCEILVRSFAKVGIIALVDEATGYQYERERQELQKILRKYISEELLPWQKRFPDEFYKEIFRLNDWGYFMAGNIDIQNRPGVIGHWTKKYVYSVLPRGVLEALLEKTPRTEKGNLKFKLHQRLTKNEGVRHLERVLASVITLMNVSESWSEFEKLWNKKYGQQELNFEERQELIEPKPEKTAFDAKLKRALEYDPKGKSD